MDHGPFSAVELLQQIASNGFVAEDILRDEISGQTKPIAECIWCSLVSDTGWFRYSSTDAETME